MDLERQKQNFKNHIATFSDYGNIKIIDFKAPDTSNYQIRFLFEEDYCRLHISGDWGNLIASNYYNMVYEKFSDFVNDTGYFEEKIDCHDRAIHIWDEEKARRDITEYMKNYDFYEGIVLGGFTSVSEEEKFEDFLNKVLEDFSGNSGIGSKGYDILSNIDSSITESITDFGKKNTGILELYMLAFKLATEQLQQRNKNKRISKKMLERLHEQDVSKNFYICTRDFDMAFDLTPRVEICEPDRCFEIHLCKTYGKHWNVKPLFESHSYSTFRELKEILLNKNYNFKIKTEDGDECIEVEDFISLMEEFNKRGNSHKDDLDCSEFSIDEDGFEFVDEEFI